MGLISRFVIGAIERRLIYSRVERRLLRRRKAGPAGEIVDNVEDLYSITHFDNDTWQAEFPAILDQIRDAVINTNPHWIGQYTILADHFVPKASSVLEDGSEYDPDEFIRVMRHKLDDYYYYAIDKLIEECASLLQELYDAIRAQNYANFALLSGIGIHGASLFSPARTTGRLYSSNAAALNNYQSIMLSKGYRLDDSPAARRHNSELNRKALIARTGPPGSGWNTGIKGIDFQIPSTYFTDMKANGFRLGDSYADHKYNSELKRQRLIEKTGPAGSGWNTGVKG
jgi:hypothetical protein